MDKVKKEEFIQFLKENYILTSFEEELNKFNLYRNVAYPTLSTYLDKRSDVRNIFVTAFPWKDTKNGEEFWNRLHQKWAKRFQKEED